MKRMNCPNCGSENILNRNRIRNVWNSIDNVSFCNDCELYFLEYIPNQNKIDEYYKKKYHHYSKETYFAKNRFRRFRSVSQFQYIVSNVKDTAGKKILEIGACDGLLLSYFKNSVVKGTEYSPVYKEIALKKYGITLTNDNFLNIDEKFDLIIMSHVIEHLPNLNETVEKLQNLLNKNGYIFIEVPNSPKPEEKDEEYINEYLATPHIYNFTKKSLESVFTKRKFNIISLDRFYYNLPDFVSPDDREGISRVFLNGFGVKSKYIPPIVLYLVKSVVSPKNSYKRIDINKPFVGLGDNLRIVCKKN